MQQWLTSERLAVLGVLSMALAATVLCALGRLNDQATIAILGGVIGTLAHRYLPGSQRASKTPPKPDSNKDDPPPPTVPTGGGASASAGMLLAGMMGGALL